MADSFRIEPLDAPLGARIHGVNLHEDQPREIVDGIIEAFEQYHVILFNGQQLNAERQLEVSRWFGETYKPPPDLPILGDASQPPIVAISNVVDGGLLGSIEIPPHSDLQFMPVPLRASMLYAVEVPERGGETSWANLCLAHDALDEATRAQIADLQVWAHNPYAGEIGAGRYIDGDQKYVDHDVPLFPHPLARVHKPTGKRALYVSILSGGIVGMDDEEEARELLERLRSHVDQERFYYRHEWSPGDVVVWDNRCTNHKRAAFEPEQRRIMYRAQIADA